MENQKIVSYPLETSSDAIIVPVRDLNPGIYFIQLMNDGKSMETKKVSVIH